MKEQVTDISKVLKGMTEEMRLLRETVNQQYAEIIKLTRNITWIRRTHVIIPDYKMQNAKE